MIYTDALLMRTLIYSVLIAIAFYIYLKKIPKERKSRLPMLVICVATLVYVLASGYMNYGYVKALDSFAVTENITPVEFYAATKSPAVKISEYNSDIVGRGVNEVRFIDEILLEEAGQIIYTSEGVSYVGKVYEIKAPTEASLTELEKYKNGEHFYQQAPNGRYYIEKFGIMYCYIDEAFLAEMFGAD